MRSYTFFWIYVGLICHICIHIYICCKLKQINIIKNEQINIIKNQFENYHNLYKCIVYILYILYTL